MARPLPEPPEHLEVTSVLHALADPVRLAIVGQLAVSDEPIACGAFNVDVSKSTLSHHFRTLRDSGVIESFRRDGRTVENALRRDVLEASFPGLLEAVLPSGHRPFSQDQSDGSRLTETTV